MQPLRGGLAPLTLASKAPRNGLLTNLVAYWGLDEAGGANNALDKHSNGLTLTQVNSPGSAAGKVYAGARTLNGSTQYFSRSSEDSLQLGSTSYAWSVWIYPSGSINDKQIINKRFDGGNYYSFRTSTGGYLIWDEWAAGIKRVEVFTTTPLNLNQWQMITAIVTRGDPAATKIYLGVTDITNATPTSLGLYAENAGNFNVGRWGGGGNYVSGRLGPIMFWKNRALDADARNALYNAGAGLAYSAFTN